MRKLTALAAMALVLTTSCSAQAAAPSTVTVMKTQTATQTAPPVTITADPVTSVETTTQTVTETTTAAGGETETSAATDASDDRNACKTWHKHLGKVGSMLYDKAHGANISDATLANAIAKYARDRKADVPDASDELNVAIKSFDFDATLTMATAPQLPTGSAVDDMMKSLADAMLICLDYDVDLSS